MEPHEKRRGIYVATAVVLLGGGLLVRNIEWQGNTSLHTLMELAATLLASFVGTMALVRFFSRRDVQFLYIGAGFLGTAMLDGFHTVVTSIYFQPYMPSDNPYLVPWSWIASRLFLSALLFISWLLWFRHRNDAGFRPNTKIVLAGTVLATMAAFLFFATAHLPTISIEGATVSRPVELLPAIFFLMALVGYLYKGAWRNDQFEHWLVLSLIVGVATQTIFMPFSEQLYDTEFNLAHLLKKLSYILVLIGLLNSLYQTYKDIQAEEEDLLKASAYARSLIEASLDPLVTISPEGKITDVNQATERVTGRSRAELTGTDFSDYFTDPDKAREGYQQVFMKGAVTDYPLALRHRDGHVTDVMYNASVYRDESGKVLGVFAAARDITEHKRAEATRTQLAAMVEFSDDAIIGKTLDNIITSWNRGAERLYGYTAQEAIGQPISLIVPEDKQQELQEFSNRIQKGTWVKHHETVRVAKDGRRIEVSLSLSPVLDDRGSITGTSAIARDITEQKRDAELIRRNNQLLETAFSSIHVMIAYLDKDFNFIKVNKAYADADQHTSDFYPGKNHFDLFPDQGNKAIFKKVAETGKSVVYYAKPFEFSEHPERGVTYWDWRLEPITGADGKVEGLLFSLLNVTEQTLSVQKIRAASAYARSLIEASLDPLVTISAEGKITDVNNATEQVTGHSRESLIGTDFSDYFTEPEQAKQGYRQAFEKGFVRDYPLDIRHRDGESTPVLYNASVYKDEHGKVIGIFAAARDITERKQAEEALRENEHFLDSLIEHLPNMLFVKDAKDLKFVRFNKAGEALLGYTRDELIGKNDRDFFPKEQADFFIAKDREIIARREMLDIAEEPISTKFLGQRYLHTRKIPVFADDGSPLYLLGISEDITERKLADEQLLRSEQGLSEAQRIARLGSWELDLASNVLSWSDEIYRIFEIDPEKFGASYEAFLNGIHPEDREMVNKAYTDSVRDKVPYDIVHRLQMQDGRIKYVNEKCETYYGEDGQPLRSVGTVHDITERKLDEEALQRLNRELRAISNCNQTLMRAEDEQALLNDICRIVCDDAGYRMAWVGYAENDEAKTIRPISWAGVEDGYLEQAKLTWADTERGRGPSGSAIRSGESVSIQDFITDPKAVPWRDAALQRGYRSSISLPIKDESANTFGILNIYAAMPNAFTPEEIRLLEELAGDMAFGIMVLRARIERQRAEEEIRTLNLELEQRVADRTAQLESANKELEAFSYSVSHDLRTPLRAIDGFSHILLEDYTDKLDEEGKRLLNVVRENTSRMGQLIDDILKFSRAGRLEITFSEIDMESMAREVYEELRPLAGHGLQVEIGHLPSAMGDRAMMRQVLVNLLSNAVKFTRAKEDARIEVGSSAGENETVYFVKDNGAGFDMQYVGKLFGVFQRLHGVTEFDGTGIGLAIVKRIITRHGGRVWAEGKVNEGATIYFTLPDKEKAHE